MAGGFAGQGEAQAPYAEYQGWHPHGAPGGYPGPGGYGEMVNGGDYAYVIREDVPGAPPQPRPGARERGPGEWPAPHAAAAQPGGGAARGRAITAGQVSAGWPASAAGPARTANAGGASPAPGPAAPAAAVQAAAATQAGPVTHADAKPKPEAAPDADPALAYGPDDPAYGPPGPDWYKRDEERAPRDHGRGERTRTPVNPVPPAAPSSRSARAIARRQATRTTSQLTALANSATLTSARRKAKYPSMSR